jgi:hypothetical protein
MHSAWNRWNILLMFAMLHAIIIIAVTQFTNTYFHDTEPVIHRLELSKVARLRVERQRDRAVLLFDFDLDMSKLFDWNCKQVFLFIEASYTAPGRPSNRAILWDDVVHTKEHAKRIVGEKVFSDYEMDDVGQHLKGANVTLKIGWDVMPYVGFVGKHYQLDFSGDSQFTMPENYGRFV